MSDLPYKAIATAATFIESEFAPKRCDSDGVSDCVRCNAVALARWALVMKDRLVNLTDIDMEALRLAVADVEMAEAVTPNILWLAARQVLAALDKGDT